MNKVMGRKMEGIIHLYRINATARLRAANDVRYTLAALQQRCAAFVERNNKWLFTGNQ